MKKLLLIFAFVLVQENSAHASFNNDECVVLLHGMGRTSFSMNSMESFLKESGYQTVSHSYPSTKLTIEKISNNIIPEFVGECNIKSRKVHFVTHSLGGIIARYYLQSNNLPEGSRVVMLSPPNKGSEIADKFRDSTWYGWLTGPPGQQLTTDSMSLPNNLGAISYEVGIITGRSTLEPWFSRLIPGEDDGKVSVESAKLEEMKDFLVVDHAHTFIMKSSEVKSQVLAFIKYGKFQVADNKKSNNVFKKRPGKANQPDRLRGRLFATLN